jgi:transposase
VTRSAELSEAAWARIEPLMPQAEGRSRPWRDHRQLVEGIVFRYRTGVAWRDLPERFGPWQTVWKRHHRFACRDEPGDHALGRSRGGLSTKIHAAVDGRGRPLVILLTPGQAGDAPILLPLLAGLRVGQPLGRPRTRPDRVLADKAYSSRAIRAHLRARGIGIEAVSSWPPPSSGSPTKVVSSPGCSVSASSSPGGIRRPAA